MTAPLMRKQLKKKMPRIKIYPTNNHPGANSPNNNNNNNNRRKLT